MAGSRVDRSLAAPSARAQELQDRMLAFVREHVLPAEAAYLAHRRQAGPGDHSVPPVIEQLKKQAQAQGLWNLFLPAESGLTQLEYAPIAELSGWSHDLAPEAINGQAPDTGNMELLHLLGTEQQKHAWLEPLLAGHIRSAFAMTEPDVASSDATNIATRIDRDGDEYVITGCKWWTSGAMDPRCTVLIVMGKTDPAAPTHRQQSCAAGTAPCACSTARTRCTCAPSARPSSAAHPSCHPARSPSDDPLRSLSDARGQRADRAGPRGPAATRHRPRVRVRPVRGKSHQGWREPPRPG